ncbi:MAG: helical backbone metal receptor [Desulfobacterales bacterium]|nr:helical backbone metal receptor [Desulfobacterales bacterium]
MAAKSKIRIISLAASITESLFAIGAGDRVVGITDSCDYPPAVSGIPDVKCWFEPDMEKLLSLKPDLVLGMETAHKKLKPILKKYNIKLVLTNPATVEDSLLLLIKLGRILNISTHSNRLVANVKNRFDELDEKVARIPIEKRHTVCRVLDWDETQLYVVGPFSFQYDVITKAGGINVTGNIPEAYPKITWKRLLKWDPDVMFICGGDRHLISKMDKDPKWRVFKAVKTKRFYRFPCGLTCRTGPRIVDMAELLFETLYGENN